MGFFSFGKKDDAPRRRGAAARSARSGGAFEGREARRSRRSDRAADADAMLLDPTLPEKQRARRRLVGAIALVLAAIVILPMVLDSHPKPVTDDIAIDIPNRPSPAPSRANNDSDDDTQAGVAPDRGEIGSPAAGIASAPAAAAAQGKATQQSAAKAAAPAPQPSSKQAESKSTSAKPVQSGAESTETARSNAAPANKPTAVATPSPADADSGTPAAPPGARFAVQLGVFGDDASARTWETKLKAVGVPAYVEHRKQADGKTRTRLLAGPFPDRAAASAAIAKVREAGLTANAAGAAQ
jgi:DedD protein